MTSPWNRFFVAVLTALLLVAAAPPVRAQACGDAVVLKELEGANGGARLCTPDGAPVVGGSFSFAVESSLPDAMGALVFSAVEAPFFDPAYGATFWFGVPFETIGFTTDADGRSPVLLEVPVLDPGLCGAFGVFQAGVFDPQAPGGVAVTNAVRIVVGEAGTDLFLQLEKPPSATPRGLTATVADFDGDGITDVLSGLFGVVVYAGLPAGGFTLLGSQSITGTVEAIEVADLDGDGKQDAVAAVSGPDRAFVLLGNGQGGFISAKAMFAAAAPTDVALGDFDEDGALDLAVGGSQDNRATMYLGDGTGKFTSAMSVDFGLGTWGLAAADLDEDGHADFVASSEATGDVCVRLGFGNGAFALPAFYAAGGAPRHLEVADLDGDSALDVVVTDEASNELLLLPGNGDGTLGGAESFEVGEGPVAIEIADVDADSHLDLVVLNRDTWDVSVLRGDGAGSFATRHYLCEELPEALAVIDGDRDGTLDLLAFNASVTDWGLLPGDGVGGFRANRRFPGASGELAEMILADLDGDGASEIVALYEGGTLRVIDVDAPDDGGITRDYAVAADARVLAGDFDGDGATDFVTLSGITPTTGSLLINRGGGALFKPKDFLLGQPTLELWASVADLDGDGRDDLVVVGDNGFLAYRGQADGTLSLSWSLTVPNVVGTEIVDLDADGHPEVVLHAGSNNLRVYRNLANGAFALPPGVYSGVGVQSTIAAADLDGDGVPDLVGYGSSSSSIFVPLLNDGAGSFTAAPSFVIDLFSAIAVRDLNRDGFADILSTSRLRYGNGDATFGPVIQFATSGFSSVLDDLNGNGALEFVVNGTDRISLVELDVAGRTLTNAGSFQAGPVTTTLVGDQDGDGIPDLVVHDDRGGAGSRFTLLVNQLGE